MSYCSVNWEFGNTIGYIWKGSVACLIFLLGLANCLQGNERTLGSDKKRLNRGEIIPILPSISSDLRTKQWDFSRMCTHVALGGGSVGVQSLQSVHHLIPSKPSHHLPCPTKCFFLIFRVDWRWRFCSYSSCLNQSTCNKEQQQMSNRQSNWAAAAVTIKDFWTTSAFFPNGSNVKNGQNTILSFWKFLSCCPFFLS